MLPVPTGGRDDLMCSDRGVPIHSLGLCRCFDGHVGDACNKCAREYVKLNGLCVRVHPQ